MVCYSQFDRNSYNQPTDICVGARVAISNVNFLPEIGLYNGAIGDVIENVYNDRPVGPNDKQHYHLPKLFSGQFSKPTATDKYCTMG